ncbi:MAG: hypothetical protein NZU74_20040 [Chloroflexaceae bacterium]|nr:hypothetical protein [Chloroflexaceae bacterium]
MRTKFSLGIILIVISVVLLVIAIYQVTPTMAVDFPCQAGLVPDVRPDTRIAYCVSLWPLEAFSGGGVYALGATDQDEITVGMLKLERQEQTLVVNDHPLEVGETYSTVRWTPSLNPWLIFTTRFFVKNEGLKRANLPTSSDTLYVSGDVYEGWLPNPAGFLILGGGILFLVQGIKERKGKPMKNQAG